MQPRTQSRWRWRWRAACGVLALQLSLSAPAQTAASATDRSAPQPRQQILFTTTAFDDGGVIPDKYTAAASPAPVSPALHWTQLPAGTQSLVLLMHDPERTNNKSTGLDVTHWLVWNIPATATGLPEGVPPGDRADGSHQIGLHSYGYEGPGAPAGGPYHHYTFELFALDTTLDVLPGKATPAEVWSTRQAVFAAMEGHVLGTAVLVGRFHR